MSRPLAHPGSFRDPAGFIFTHGGRIHRQINKSGQADYEHFMRSGLYEELTSKGWLVDHDEVKSKSFDADPERFLVIKPQQVPFVSYPYEWTFDQLKDAAKLTLDVQIAALARGMILKDASAYNVQFIGKRPILIDTLSFAIYNPGQAWDGYKQYCEHFIAPLAVTAYSSPEMLRSLQVFIDGIPLPIATSILPGRARMRRGLLTHIFLHAVAQKRYDKAGSKGQPAKKRRLSELALNGLIVSLQGTIKRLQPRTGSTEWGDYYQNTNYSTSSFSAKQKLVSRLLKQVQNLEMAWDIGANDGRFSQLAAQLGAYTVAFDIDSLAVTRNYRHAVDEDINSKLLPLVQDLTNPSPNLGWANSERASLISRGPADVVLALAVVHHLAISNNLPLPRIAEFLASIGRYVIIEFVPKTDSKVKILLASRPDIFPDYTSDGFEKAMSKYFKLVDKKTVSGSKRSIYLYKVL